MWPFSRSQQDKGSPEALVDSQRKSLVRRLDMFLMVYCCLAYTVKYIDQQAHTNAYVSGMKEDLGLYGNELNTINSLFSVGYCIGTFPSQALVAKFRPSLVIPIYELLWSCMIMANAAAKNASLLYGMRFLIGVLESIAYPGFIAVLSSWYTPRELAKRIALVNASSAAGSMFSGYLATGMLAGMQGRGGMAAWRWLFVFDGIISLPVACLGFFCIPDSPQNCRAKWLSASHIEVATARMEAIGRAPRGRLTLAKVLAIFKEYPIYMMLLIYPLEVVSSQAISYFSLFLKANPDGHKFSAYQVNLIPTGGQALQIVATLLFATISDRIGKRWPIICTQMLCGFTGFCLLTNWTTSGFNGQFAGYMLIYCTVGSGALSLTWYSELTGADAEIRTLVVGIVNGVSLAYVAGLPFVMYPNVQAPRYKVGYPMGIAFYGTAILGTLTLAYLVHRFGIPYSNVPKGDRDSEVIDVEAAGEPDSVGEKDMAVRVVSARV